MPVLDVLETPVEPATRGRPLAATDGTIELRAVTHRYEDGRPSLVVAHTWFRLAVLSSFRRHDQHLVADLLRLALGEVGPSETVADWAGPRLADVAGPRRLSPRGGPYGG